MMGVAFWILLIGLIVLPARGGRTVAGVSGHDPVSRKTRPLKSPLRSLYGTRANTRLTGRM